MWERLEDSLVLWEPAVAPSLLRLCEVDQGLFSSKPKQEGFYFLLIAACSTPYYQWDCICDKLNYISISLLNLGIGTEIILSSSNWPLPSKHCNLVGDPVDESKGWGELAQRLNKLECREIKSITSIAHPGGCWTISLFCFSNCDIKFYLEIYRGNRRALGA